MMYVWAKHVIKMLDLHGKTVNTHAEVLMVFDGAVVAGLLVDPTPEPTPAPEPPAPELPPLQLGGEWDESKQGLKPVALEGSTPGTSSPMAKWRTDEALGERKRTTAW